MADNNLRRDKIEGRSALTCQRRGNPEGSRKRIASAWIISAVLFLTFCAICSRGVAKEEARAAQPNIIFIFADDWGWGDLGCHGHEYLETPNLDRLAAQGTDFQQFYVCNPVCSPSRVAVMTGQFPARHSVHEHFYTSQWHRQTRMTDWLDPAAPMLPRIFQQAGYRTGHFGKWHLTSERIKDAPAPSAYGYDEAAVFRRSPDGPQLHPNDAVDHAIRFIQKDRHRPFFINLWLHETHAPYYPSDESMRRFAHLQKQDQVYAATVADADDRIGKLLRVLEELKLEENTMVLFSSDNGPEVTNVNRDGPDGFKEVAGYLDSPYGSYYCVGTSGGLRARKRSLYEGGVRVPFIVRWPGRVPAGRVERNAVLATVDLLPTFCSAAGIPLPQGYAPDGEDMLPVLAGGHVLRTKPLFWEWRGYSLGDNWPRLAVRDGDWKLLMPFDKSRLELYRITDDRSESRNLAPQFPEVAERLADMALKWKASLPTEPPAHCITRH